MNVVPHESGPSSSDDPTVLWVLPTPRGLAECWALDAYTRPPDGRTRVAELFTKAKYQHLGPPLMVLRRMFAEGAVSISRFRSWPSDIVVVPLASSSELPMELARAAAAALEVPLLRLFRQPSGPKMKNVPIAARDAGAEGRAAVDLRATCSPNVVLIDDLVQTGSTLAAAALALRGIGARWMVAIAAVQIH